MLVFWLCFALASCLAIIAGCYLTLNQLRDDLTAVRRQHAATTAGHLLAAASMERAIETKHKRIEQLEMECHRLQTIIKDRHCASDAESALAESVCRLVREYMDESRSIYSTGDGETD